MKYRDPETGEFKELYVKAIDTLPVGTEVDYEGDEAPAGWEELKNIPDPTLYSNEEKIIGTWVAGQPLYRKVMIFNTAIDSANSENKFAHNIENANLVMVKNAFMYYFSKGTCFPLPITLYKSNTAEDKLSIYADREYIYFNVGTSWDYNFYKVVVLEYTKN